MTEKRCAGCPTWFTPRKGKQNRTRFHSPACYTRWRQQQPAWQELQRKALAKGREVIRKKATATAIARATGCKTPLEGYRLGRRQGIEIGWKRGQRVGYAQGYEAALKDMRRTA